MGSGSLDERDELRRLAEAARDAHVPGEWRDHDQGMGPVCHSYIDAASPDVVLRVLDELGRLVDLLDRMQRFHVLDSLNGPCNCQVCGQARATVEAAAIPSKESPDA